MTEHELIFSKAEKLHEPVGQVQFEVFDLQVLIHTKLHEKLCHNLFIIFMKKASQKSGQTKF